MKEQISGRQVTYTALGVILGTVFLPIGQAAALSGGRDSWMIILPAFMSAFPFVYLALYVYLRTPGKDLLQQAKQFLGPWLGYPFIVLFCLTSASFTSLLLRQGGELFVRGIMVETPLWFFIFGILVLVMFMVYLGIEVFARFIEATILPLLFSLLMLIVLSIMKSDIGYLKPYLYNGYKPLITGLLALPWGFEYIIFLFILLPYINKPHEVIRSSLRAYILISCLLTGLVVTEYCVFGPEETARLFYGAFSLARMTEIGRTVYGLEPFFILFWFGASLIKTAAFFFCTYYSFKVIFPTKHKLLPILIMGLILGLGAFVPRNSVEMVKIIDFVDKFLIVPIATLGLSLLAIVGYLKSRCKT